jgi:membrane-associated phospholipid phosphatase
MVNELVSSLLFVIGLVLVGMSFGSKKGLLKGMLCILAGSIATIAIKALFWEPRPCEGLSFCPGDSGIVSGHALVSMMFALAYYNKKEFIFFLFLALAVSLSRIWFGIHDIAEVGRSIGIAVLLNYAIGVAFNGGNHKKG